MLVEHHTHYKEIHGFDRTVWMTMSEHVKLHNRLRKESKCKVPVSELTKISVSAFSRTKKRKHYRSVYQKKNISAHDFCETMMPNVLHREYIEYNLTTGSVCCTFRFLANHGGKLLNINISGD